VRGLDRKGDTNNELRQSSLSYVLDDGRPVGAAYGLQASNRLVRSRSKDGTGATSEKALSKVSGVFRGDECK